MKRSLTLLLLSLVCCAASYAGGEDFSGPFFYLSGACRSKAVPARYVCTGVFYGCSEYGPITGTVRTGDGGNREQLGRAVRIPNCSDPCDSKNQDCENPKRTLVRFRVRKSVHVSGMIEVHGDGLPAYPALYYNVPITVQN